MKPNSLHTTVWPAICIGVLGGALCLHELRRGQEESQSSYVFGLDTTLPEKTELKNAQDASGRIENLPDGTHVEVDLFGHDCLVFYSGEKPEDIDTFNQKLRKALALPLTSRGTYPAKFCVRLHELASSSLGKKSLKARVYTDGDDDEADLKKPEYASALRMLASDKSVASLTFSGVLTDNQLLMQHLLASLGERARVLGPGEVDSN